MGIRYYAYAFSADQTERALADPRSILSSDPLADAWGLEPHAASSIATFEQTVPERDMLYLDKAWSALQALTGPIDETATPRPAYRMFEGRVTMHQDGWYSWVRTLVPAEVEVIARDLSTITDDDVRRLFDDAGPGMRDPQQEIQYVLEFLHRAQLFADRLAADGRGCVYMIG